MPRNVKLFLLLSYISIAVGVAMAVIDYPRFVEISQHLGTPNNTILIQSITFLILIGFISAIGFGRQNWARWVLLVMFVLGLITTIPTFMTMSKMGITVPIHPAAFALQTILQAVGLYLVFTGDAKAWFRRED